MDQRKRYQIFISSTYSDLIEERDKVTQAVLELNCFPTGMEIFPAAGIPPKNLIENVLKGCDYYLLIIGARYGSLTDEGISFTEWEYDIAVDSDIPVLAFLHKNISSIPLGKTDENKALLAKVKKFRRKVERGGQTVKYWENPDDLKAKVLSSIPQAIELQPRIGWVRANSVISGDAQKEVERLQKEIEKYQNEVKRLEVIVKENDEILKNKDKEYQKEIERLNVQIKSLEAELKRVKPHLKTETFTVKGVSFKMVHVKGGTFMMGADGGDGGAFSDEKPAHEVTLSDYWMGETQVTQALWRAVIGWNPSGFKGGQNLPVESVSWEDCQTFIRRLNDLTGKRFHLPTEAQWEFAARGGSLGKYNHYQYAGSNNIFDVAWFEGNSKGKTHPVREHEPNELGLFDMSGNVFEWCNDGYNEDYYLNSPTVDPTGPVRTSYRVRRGGSWRSGSRSCRVSYRNYSASTITSSDLGLRLAL